MALKRKIREEVKGKVRREEKEEDEEKRRQRREKRGEKKGIQERKEIEKGGMKIEGRGKEEENMKGGEREENKQSK